jgi:hypothetical protein
LLRFRSLPNTSLDFASVCVPVKKKKIADTLIAQVEINLNNPQPFC